MPSLGPWMGLDLVHDDDEGLFQLPGELEKRLPALTEAVNVDLDNDGWPATRSPVLDVASIIDGTRLFSSTSGYIFLQTGGDIQYIDANGDVLATLVTGLDDAREVIFHEFASQIWWTNGEACGRIEEGLAKNWGAVAAPPPTLLSVAGTLPSGRYLVACTYTDAYGVEHGAQKAALITLASTGGISVDIPSLAPEATHLNIYASSTDQKGLNWASTVAVGSLPASLTSLDAVRSTTRPCRTLGMGGPIPGDGIFSYLGLLLIWRNNVLFRSHGLHHHLFYTAQHVLAFPSKIVAGEGLESGFWIATQRGLWWVTGEAVPTTNNFRFFPVRKDVRAYAAGSAIVGGALIPALQTAALVALFVSEDGLVAGLPSGQLVALMDERIKLDVIDYRTSIAVQEVNGIRQIVFTGPQEETPGIPVDVVTHLGEPITHLGEYVTHSG